jgi:hypothetical protein
MQQRIASSSRWPRQRATLTPKTANQSSSKGGKPSETPDLLRGDFAIDQFCQQPCRRDAYKGGPKRTETNHKKLGKEKTANTLLSS